MSIQFNLIEQFVLRARSTRKSVTCCSLESLPSVDMLQSDPIHGEQFNPYLSRSLMDDNFCQYYSFSNVAILKKNPLSTC